MTTRALQIDYLRAMGIEVWLPRLPAEARQPYRASSGEPSAAAPVPNPEPRWAGFSIGPGTGNLLLLCADPRDTALPIAADIARAVGGAPVWGWPAPVADAPGTTLEDAIRERLFTGVVVFGDAARGDVAGGDAAIRGSARILQVATLAELARDPAERRKLWAQLRTSGWCPPRGRDGTHQ